ncbi:MAG TPA: hypothetical protein VKX46_19830, partial [Ktedonobacteraceae bacterium]|nr:hypothetical protein [Ktedonobacteraceae bacterium]
KRPLLVRSKRPHAPNPVHDPQDARRITGRTRSGRTHVSGQDARDRAGRGQGAEDAGKQRPYYGRG